MGREHIGTGKRILLCIACLIFSLFWGCVSVKNIEKQEGGKTEKAENSDGRVLLQRQKLVEEGDFEGALKENENIISVFKKEPPVDQAIYNMGLIYAHYNNPGKDFNKSLMYFEKLIEEYPESPLAMQARILAELLKKIILEDEYLVRSAKMLTNGDYQGALKENRKVLSLNTTAPPADQALFNIGLIYAHYGNPDKDYREAALYFEKLIQKYPESPLAEQAKIWINTLNIIEKAKQVDIEIDKKKKELTR